MVVVVIGTACCLAGPGWYTCMQAGLDLGTARAGPAPGSDKIDPPTDDDDTTS